MADYSLLGCDEHNEQTRADVRWGVILLWIKSVQTREPSPGAARGGIMNGAN